MHAYVLIGKPGKPGTKCTTTTTTLFDTSCLEDRCGVYVQEQHGQTNECYSTLAEAASKCLAAGDCGAVATQSNVGGGCYRVTHGGPTLSLPHAHNCANYNM